MPDYAYYRETYLGEDIPEAAFPRCIRRAAAELARMRDVYAVAPRPGLDPCEAEAMALCAIADAVYEFDQEDEAREGRGFGGPRGHHGGPGFHRPPPPPPPGGPHGHYRRGGCGCFPFVIAVLGVVGTVLAVIL